MSTAAAAPGIHPSAEIDPTARVHETATIGEGAVIGPEASVGPHCVVGARSVLRARAMLVERVTIGVENDVHPYAVLGGDPQDKSFDRAKGHGEVVIGDRNVFREHVTVNRGNWNGPATRIGSGNYLMTLAHVGHNAQIGDQCVLANTAMLAGHSRLGNGVVMSGLTAVHQFTEVGDGVMFQGRAAVSMHVPPYVVVAGDNFVAGLNRVGLRRNPAFTPADREQIKTLYRLYFRERGGRRAEEIVAAMESVASGEAARRFTQFIKQALAYAPPRARGVCGGRARQGGRWRSGRSGDGDD
ncbi:MAG: acyl-ACP--UDP-N-acetylglucosamine O-acyltransferase [Phycisphaerales bacterium]|nr:acyl-ACP--UDP-N-acetylglucosamine O-acyltransferase [Phycisphaerales bacterium]